MQQGRFRDLDHGPRPRRRGALCRARDGANPHNFELSRRKAYTAKTFRSPSANFVGKSAPDKDLYGQRELKEVIPLGGGMPIMIGQDAIGAVGISGAKGGQPAEEACAKAGIAAIQSQLS